MKKLVLLLAVFAVGIMSTYANNLNEPEEPKKMLRSEIIEKLQTPNFAIEQETTVTIKFTFNSEGEMVVLCPGCKDKKMKKYIAAKLNQKKFENPGERNKVYHMPLTFKIS